jgi:hypothetical protein
MDWYAVFPSNASPDIYPDNRTSRFKVQLSERVELHGDWQVALLEVQYPATFPHVQKGNDWIKLTSPIPEARQIGDGVEAPTHNHYTQEKTYQMRVGYYNDARHFVDSLQETLKPLFKSSSSDDWDRTVIDIGSSNRLVFPRLKYHERASYEFAPQLAYQLGLTHPGPYEAHKTLVGEKSVDISIGTPQQMFVYLNLIQDQIVGHTRAPLLRTIPVTTEAKFGSMSTYRCKPPLYFDLKTRSFDSIEVNIRTSTGEFMPFSHGSLSLLCHFKPRS